jgi:hypothetical protein
VIVAYVDFPPQRIGVEPIGGVDVRVLGVDLTGDRNPHLRPSELATMRTARCRNSGG